MLADLTPDQEAKLRNGWVWVEGQKPFRCKERVYVVCDDGEVCVGDPERDIWFQPGELEPDLDDDATADGLLRTARAMWHDESLCCSNDRTGWYVRVLAKSHPYAPVFIARGETEKDALLAAILAAPEAA